MRSDMVERMSEREQFEIAGRTLKEHGDAVRRLATLEAKARSYGTYMRIVANELSPSKIRPLDYSSDGLTEALGRCPNRDEVTELLEQLRETSAKVEELAEA